MRRRAVHLVNRGDLSTGTDILIRQQQIMYDHYNYVLRHQAQFVPYKIVEQDFLFLAKGDQTIMFV